MHLVLQTGSLLQPSSMRNMGGSESSRHGLNQQEVEARPCKVSQDTVKNIYIYIYIYPQDLGAYLSSGHWLHSISLSLHLLNMFFSPWLVLKNFPLKNTTFQHGLYVCKRLTSPGLGVLRGKKEFITTVYFSCCLNQLEVSKCCQRPPFLSNFSVCEFPLVTCASRGGTEDGQGGRALLGDAPRTIQLGQNREPSRAPPSRSVEKLAKRNLELFREGGAGRQVSPLPCKPSTNLGFGACSIFCMKLGPPFF